MVEPTHVTVPVAETRTGRRSRPRRPRPRQHGARAAENCRRSVSKILGCSGYACQRHVAECRLPANLLMPSPDQAQLPWGRSDTPLPQAPLRSHAHPGEPAERPVGVTPAPRPQPVAPRVDGAEPASARTPMLLTVRDVEAELQLGRTRTYELLRSGSFPVLRVGRAVRVPRDALRRWVEEHTA
jgi:excisionase family DNA binding protein